MPRTGSVGNRPQIPVGEPVIAVGGGGRWQCGLPGPWCADLSGIGCALERDTTHVS